MVNYRIQQRLGLLMYDENWTAQSVRLPAFAELQQV